MKIQIIGKKAVLTTEHGRLPFGMTVEVSPALANFLIERGDAVLLETKVNQDRPIQAAGVVEPLSVSPVAQVSQQTTLSESENGVKRRGRKQRL